MVNVAMFKSTRINGKKLAALRYDKGFHAAEDLARAIGRASGSLRRYEQSENVGIDPDVLDEIATAMKMERADLLKKIVSNGAPATTKKSAAAPKTSDVVFYVKWLAGQPYDAQRPILKKIDLDDLRNTVQNIATWIEEEEQRQTGEPIVTKRRRKPPEENKGTGA